jgi:hypothetical protein
MVYALGREIYYIGKESLSGMSFGFLNAEACRRRSSLTRKSRQVRALAIALQGSLSQQALQERSSEYSSIPDKKFL